MKEIFSPTSIHYQLSKKIQILRVKRGWSQEALAGYANVHRNYIGLVERVELNVGLANIAKIASAFEIPVHELLDMQTVETRNPP